MRESQAEKERIRYMDSEIYPAEKKEAAGHQNADRQPRKAQSRLNHDRRGTRTPATWGPVDPLPQSDEKVDARAPNSWQQAVGRGTQCAKSHREEPHRDIRRGLERMWDLMHGRNHRRRDTNESDQPPNAAAEPRDEGAD